MKWTLLSNPAASVHLFNLTETNVVKEVLRYNPLQQSARITFTDRQSLFFIEQAGFRNNQFIFKNEYGFDFGRFSIDIQNGNNGTIEFEGKKMQYTISSSQTAELVIYEQDSTKPVAVCHLQQDNQLMPVLKNKKAICEFGCLVLGLCWHVYRPAGKEAAMESKKELSVA